MSEPPSFGRRNVHFDIPDAMQPPKADAVTNQVHPTGYFPPFDTEQRPSRSEQGSSRNPFSSDISQDISDVAPLRVPQRGIEPTSRAPRPVNSLRIQQPAGLAKGPSNPVNLLWKDTVILDAPALSPSATFAASPLPLSEAGDDHSQVDKWSTDGRSPLEQKWLENDGEENITVRHSRPPLRPVLSSQRPSIPQMAYQGASGDDFVPGAPYLITGHDHDRRSFAPQSPPNIYRQPSGNSTALAPTLRSALRRSQSGFDLGKSEDLKRGGTGLMEEGGGTRPSKGVFANLLTLYGISGGRHRSQSHGSFSTRISGISRSRCGSMESTAFPTARDFGDRSRCNSMMSEGYDLVDPDDPRITGVPKNTIDQQGHAKDTVEDHASLTKRKKRQASIKYHISCEPHFIGVRVRH